MYLGAHEHRYSLSIEHSDRTDDKDYVSLQILYREDPEGQASSTSISVNTEELAAALKAFLPTKNITT